MVHKHTREIASTPGNTLPSREIFRVGGLPSPVGICGHIGAGKSTAAEFLIEQGYKRLPFAKPLKSMLHAIGLTPAHTDGRLKEVPCKELCGKTPRFSMQMLGTEWGRELIGKSLWVNAWMRMVLESHAAGVPVVCDDMRFPNEALMVQRLGGFTIYISRIGHGASEHPSEASIKNLPRDFTILNDFSKEELYESLGGILELLDSPSNSGAGS